MSINICVIDADANVIQANRHYADLVGQVPSAVIGRNISEWLQPADWLEQRRIMAKASATGAASDFVFTYNRPDGSFAVVVGEALPLLPAGGAYMVACSRVVYASTGVDGRRAVEAAEYVAAMAAELARAADRAGLSALGSSLRDVNDCATALLRAFDDAPRRHPPVGG
jgi:PAS domain S-box-containing protein